MHGEQLQQCARDIAASLEGVTRGRPFTPHLDVWKVHGKVFLVVTEGDPALRIITVKVDPQFADALRRDVDTITAGRYFDKNHWISVGPGTGITTHLVDDLVHMSYDLADIRRGTRRS
jgi:predicted DNA-binding protein (MmcQ/YjbR family)